MKKRLAYALATLFLLTGCASGGQAAQVASSTPAAAPSTPAEPVPMSIEEAGVYYLKNVCQGGHLSIAFSDTYELQAERYNSGLKPKMAPVKKAAAKVRDSLREEADALSDEGVVWPQEVQKDIKKLVDEMYDYVAIYANASRSDDLEEIAAIFDEAGFSSSTGQKIRAKLDLSADTEKSCKKYIDS